MNYKYITDNSKLETLINNLIKSNFIFFDLETSGLDPHSDKICLIQLGLTKNHLYLIDPFTTNIISALQENQKKIFNCNTILSGYNLKFDIQFFWSSNIDITDCKLYDLYIAANLIDNYTIKESLKFGMKDVVERHLHQELNKEEQHSDWTQRPLTPEQLQYAAKDIDLFELYTKLMYKINKYDLNKVFNIENRCLPGTASMEWYGIHTTKNLWEDLKPRYKKELVEKSKRLYDNFSDLHCQPTWNGECLPEASLDSHAQLKELLSEFSIPHPINEGMLLDSTGANLLKLIDTTKYPVIQDILNYRKVTKILTTYCDHYKYINPNTGRIHPSFFQLFTITGRFSCRNPNLQQLPKDITFRKPFIAEKNYSIVGADFSQIEVRMMTELTQIKDWILLYNEDLDVYCFEAARYDGIKIELTKEWVKMFKKEYDKQRTGAKPIVLGSIYGLGAPKLKNQAKAMYGIDMSLAETKHKRKVFFEQCPTVPLYHKEQARFAEKNGYLETLSGRKLFNHPDKPILYTQCANYKDQGSCADIIKICIGDIYYELKNLGYSPTQSHDVKLILTIHDELELEIKNELVEWGAKFLQKQMVKAGQTFIKCIPVKAEPLIGKSLAEVKD